MKHVIILMQLFVFTLFGLEAVQAAALLQIAINPNPVSPGDTLTVELTVSNSGDTSLSNVEVHLSYPEELQAYYTHYIALGGDSSLQGVSCGAIVSTTCSAGEIVVWDVGLLTPGAGTSMQMLPAVATAVADGTLIQFEAEVWVDGEQAVQKSRTIMTQESTPFELSVDESVNPVGEDTDMIYSLSYSNLGATSDSSQLRFPVPGNTSFVGASTDGVLVDDTVVWDLGSLVSSTGGKEQVHLSVDGGDGELVYVDSLQLNSTYSNNIEQTTEATRITIINSGETPEFALSINPDPASPGDTLTVGLTVSNSGDTSLSNVEVHLRYPEELQASYISYFALGGDSNIQGVSCGAIVSTTCSAGEIVVWDVGLLTPGAGTSLQMLPAVATNVVGGALIQFDAEVWVDGVQVVQKSRTIMTQESTPFELSVDESVNPVGEATDMIYSLSYSNLGATSDSSQLRFPIPGNTSFVGASTDGVLVDDTVVWDLGSLVSSTSGKEEVQLSVDGGDGELVYVDSLQLNSTYSNNIEQTTEATRITIINSGETPEFALSINPDPASPGDTLTVGLTVSNSGETSLSNVEVHLRYPEELQASYTSYFALGGDSNIQGVSCGAIVSTTCSAGEIVVWDVGLLTPGAGTSLQMLPAVATNVVGGTLIQFEAEVWVDGVQVVQKSRTIMTQESTPFELSADESVNPAGEDTDMIYSLSYSNLGATTSGTKLSFVVPEHSCFISASDGGKFEAGNVNWNLDNLLSHAGGERQVRLSVAGEEGHLVVLDSLQLTGLGSNSVEHKSEVTRITKINNSETPELIVLASPQPASVGETLTVGVTVLNPGDTPLSNVEVHLRYPAGIGPVYANNISLGGDSSIQDVSCGAIVATTCSVGEIVVWEIGTLGAGQTSTFEMTPVISNVEEGTQIQLEASVWVDGWQRISKAETVFVGSMFDGSGYTPTRADINSDGIVSLDDLILVLQNLAGYDVNFTEFGDCNCDGKIGLPEAMAILQELK